MYSYYQKDIDKNMVSGILELNPYLYDIFMKCVKKKIDVGEELIIETILENMKPRVKKYINNVDPGMMFLINSKYGNFNIDKVRDTTRYKYISNKIYGEFAQISWSENNKITRVYFHNIKGKYHVLLVSVKDRNKIRLDFYDPYKETMITKKEVEYDFLFDKNFVVSYDSTSESYIWRGVGYPELTDDFKLNFDPNKTMTFSIKTGEVKFKIPPKTIVNTKTFKPVIFVKK